MDIDRHESDLYLLPKDEAQEKIIVDFLRKKGYSFIGRIQM
jgi:hypothetical protein